MAPAAEASTSTPRGFSSDQRLSPNTVMKALLEA